MIWLRRIGMVVLVLVLLLCVALGSAYAKSAGAIGTGHTFEAHPFDASIGNADEGRRLATLYGCSDCHAANFGGQLLIDDMPFARLSAPNLTSGRDGGAFTDEQFEGAVRHGVGTQGTALYVMPSAEYHYLSDQDVADILAYIRSVPAVTDDLPERALGPVGRVVVAIGGLPSQPEILAEDAEAEHLDKPSVDQPEQLGYYYTRLCVGCHGTDLAGAPAIDPAAPPGPNLTPAGNPGSWTRDDFVKAMRTGMTPDGRALDPMFMPWSSIGTAQDAELDAIWAYLSSLDPVASAETP